MLELVLFFLDEFERKFHLLGILEEKFENLKMVLTAWEVFSHC